MRLAPVIGAGSALGADCPDLAQLAPSPGEELVPYLLRTVLVPVLVALIVHNITPTRRDGGGSNNAANGGV